MARLRILEEPECQALCRAMSSCPDVLPVYACHGKDHVVRPAWSRRVARERLGVEPVEMRGGHSPFLARPEELADVLLAGL